MLFSKSASYLSELCMQVRLEDKASHPASQPVGRSDGRAGEWFDLSAAEGSRSHLIFLFVTKPSWFPQTLDQVFAQFDLFVVFCLPPFQLRLMSELWVFVEHLKRLGVGYVSYVDSLVY